MLRRTYLDRIRPYFHSEQIKAIVGSRRAGKSTIMNQIIEELSLSVSRDRIVYFYFEDYEMSIYLDDPKRFYRIVKNYIQGKERCYIFCDSSLRTGFLSCDTRHHFHTTKKPRPKPWHKFSSLIKSESNLDSSCDLSEQCVFSKIVCCLVRSISERYCSAVDELCRLD